MIRTTFAFALELALIEKSQMTRKRGKEDVQNSNIQLELDFANCNLLLYIRHQNNCELGFICATSGPWCCK